MNKKPQMKLLRKMCNFPFPFLFHHINNTQFTLISSFTSPRKMSEIVLFLNFPISHVIWYFLIKCILQFYSVTCTLAERERDRDREKVENVSDNSSFSHVKPKLDWNLKSQFFGYHHILQWKVCFLICIYEFLMSKKALSV